MYDVVLSGVDVVVLFRRERLWKAHMTAGLLLYEDLKTGELFRIQRYRQRRRGVRFWQDGNAEPAMVAMAGSGTGSELANDHAADRVAGAEGADDAQTAGRQIILELVEGNDGAGGTGIGVLIQHHRRLLLQVRITSQQLAGNQHVHVQVGLVQPETADLGHRNVQLLQLLGDQL